MPRDSSGNYTLPLADVVGGDPILADGWANPTLEDLRFAMESSLSRDGQGGMRAPLPFSDGSVSAPTITFTNERTAGLYRNAAQDIRMAVNGQPIMSWRNNRAEVRNPDTGTLQQIATVDQIQSVSLPDGTNTGDRLVWNTAGGGSWQAAAALTAASIPYSGDVTATFVAQAIDVNKAEIDANKSAADASIAALQSGKADTSALNAHVNTSDIHVPVTGATAIAVVPTLPGTPNPNTIYLVTT